MQMLVVLLCATATAIATEDIQQVEARETVTRLYQEILEREPDAAGMATWSEHIRRGRDEAWLEQVLRESPEGKAVAEQRKERRLKRGAWSIASLLALIALAWGAFRYPCARRKAVKILALTVISLALGELALRICHRVSPLPIFYDDSYNRYRGKPHADDWGFKLNSMGFKDVEFEKDKGARFRIVGIGDSFAFGVVPYAFNYLTLLEEGLKAEEYDVDVLNMGIASTAPQQYRDLLVREALPLDPDLVLVSFFVGNDFTESERHPRKREWHERSFIASLVRYLAAVRPQQEGWEAHGHHEYRDDAPMFPKDTYLKIERDRSYPYIRSDQYLPRVAEDALHYLTDIRDICRKRDLKLVVVIIPDELQVNAQLRREVRDTYFSDIPEDDWDVERPNHLLTAGLAELEIPHLDLREAFVDKGQTQSLYRPCDSHWNIPGNRLAAELIQQFLTSAPDYLPR